MISWRFLKCKTVKYTEGSLLKRDFRFQNLNKVYKRTIHEEPFGHNDVNIILYHTCDHDINGEPLHTQITLASLKNSVILNMLKISQIKINHAYIPAFSGIFLLHKAELVMGAEEVTQ